MKNSNMKFNIVIGDLSPRTVFVENNEVFVEIVKESCHCGACWKRLKTFVVDMTNRGKEFNVTDRFNNSRAHMIGVTFSIQKKANLQNVLSEMLGSSVKILN